MDNGEKRSLFQFYHELDLKRDLQRMLWFFNKTSYFISLVSTRGRSITVPLVFANFWFRVHNLLMGFMSEGMVRQFGNFIG